MPGTVIPSTQMIREEIRLRCIEAAATAMQGHAIRADDGDNMIGIAFKLERYVLGKTIVAPVVVSGGGSAGDAP